MILYIDETGNEEYFIVSGIIFDNEIEVGNVYKKFRKIAKNYIVKHNDRERVFQEFKSTILDKSYTHLKNKMLSLISENTIRIIYSSKEIDKNDFTQDVKEKVYIDLLMQIVKNINDEIDIVFDSLKNNILK